MFCISAEKAGYQRAQVLSMKDGDNKMPLHTAVQSGDVQVGNSLIYRQLKMFKDSRILYKFKRISNQVLNCISDGGGIGESRSRY